MYSNLSSQWFSSGKLSEVIQLSDHISAPNTFGNSSSITVSEPFYKSLKKNGLMNKKLKNLIVVKYTEHDRT